VPAKLVGTTFARAPWFSTTMLAFSDRLGRDLDRLRRANQT
jgi:hypothetical protein